jgi:hypothetical protein
LVNVSCAKSIGESSRRRQVRNALRMRHLRLKNASCGD